jgi:beta-glucosidase
LRYGTASNVDSGAEVGGKQWTHAIDSNTKAKLDSRSSLNPEEGTDSTTYTFGEDNDIDLIDLRGKAYDDELWEGLLNEITLTELTKLIEECGYCSPDVKSINKAKVNDLDGPAGLNKVVGHGSADIGDGYLAMIWPSEYMLACTWDESLAETMGNGIGEDGLYSGVVGWYGPAMNIHRTPFGGRNFEYYSEDSFLSGVLGRAETLGAAKKGMYAFIKHFALNDQETHRDQLGLVTWANEQSIREIYLKPFEMCIKDFSVTIDYNEPVRDENNKITGYVKKQTQMPATFGVMSSFNRIGTTWAGGNYNLISGVLRKEWGYNGFVLTDYEVNSYMVTNQTLAAGGDAKLKTVDMSSLFGTSYDLAENPADQGYAREAAHHILYTIVNSAAMNGYVHGRVFINGFAYYKIFLIVFDVLATAGVALLGVVIYKKLRRKNN